MESNFAQMLGDQASSALWLCALILVALLASIFAFRAIVIRSRGSRRRRR